MVLAYPMTVRNQTHHENCRCGITRRHGNRVWLCCPALFGQCRSRKTTVFVLLLISYGQLSSWVDRIYVPPPDLAWGLFPFLRTAPPEVVTFDWSCTFGLGRTNLSRH